jgi:hypothetical protein
MQLMELVVCTQTVRTGSDSWLGALIDSSFWGIVTSLWLNFCSFLTAFKTQNLQSQWQIKTEFVTATSKVMRWMTRVDSYMADIF